MHAIYEEDQYKSKQSIHGSEAICLCENCVDDAFLQTSPKSILLMLALTHTLVSHW